MAIIPKVYGAIKGLGTFTARNKEDFGRLRGAVLNYGKGRQYFGLSGIGDEATYIFNNAAAGAKDDMGKYSQKIVGEGDNRHAEVSLQTDILNRALINLYNVDGRGGLDYSRLGAVGAIGATGIVGAAAIYDQLSNH